MQARGRCSVCFLTPAGGIAYSAADSTTISLTRADNPTLHHLHMELQVWSSAWRLADYLPGPAALAQAAVRLFRARAIAILSSLDDAQCI